MVNWGIPENAVESIDLVSNRPPSQKLRPKLILSDFPMLITVQLKGKETYSNSSLLESIQRNSNFSNLIFVKRSNTHLRKAIVMVTTKSILKTLGDVHLRKVIVYNDIDPDVDAVDGDGDGDGDGHS